MKTTDKQTSKEQKPVEEVMQAGFQLLPLIMNNIPQAVFWKDSNLVYLGCNQAFADDAGFSSPEEVVGKTDFDMPWKDQAELYRSDDRLVMERGEPKLNYEEPQTTPSGSTIWLRTSKIPVEENGQIVAVLGMYEDITAQKQVEETVRESEERFRRFTEATNEGLVFHEQGKIVDANPAALAMFGLTETADFIGRSLLEFILPESHELVLAKMQLEDVQPYEIRCIRADHSIFPVETSTRTYKSGDRTIRASSIRDITERKRSEEIVQENRARFQGLVETLSDWIWEVDPNGIYTYVSPKIRDVLGYEPEEVLGKTPFDLMSPEEAQRVAGIFGPLLSAQQPLDALENTNLHKDGHLVVMETSALPFYDVNGNFKGYRGTDRDITQRKQADQALRESQQLLQTVMDNIPQSIFWKDSNLTYLGCNKAFADDTGLASSSDVIGKTDWDMPWKEQAELYRADDSLVMKSGTPKLNYEEPQTTPDGSTIWLRTSKVPLRDVDGSVYAVLGMYEDITERKNLEQQIQTAFERRGRHVQLSTQIAQSIASAASLEELYQRVVTQVKEQFGYYHTQLLRYDAAQDAVVLVTGYGETGAKMLSAGHRLPMGTGLIGTAAEMGETVLRPKLENDPDWHPHPLLPDTKGEIAVPIKLGDTILGVLDVQSNVADALGPDDQLLLEGLCGQIATAIESTRLRQEMDERLAEVDRLYRAMSHEGWQVYRQTENLPAGFIYNQMTVIPLQETELANETFIEQPIAVPGGGVIGT